MTDREDTLPKYGKLRSQITASVIDATTFRSFVTIDRRALRDVHDSNVVVDSAASFDSFVVADFTVKDLDEPMLLRKNNTKNNLLMSCPLYSESKQ